jgi:hypothetical protein
MKEKLEPIELLCYETEQQTVLRRGRTLKDLKTKGSPFENWISEQILSHAKVVLSRRNDWIGDIPPEEYLKARQKYKEMINKPDIIIIWNAESQIILECAYRKQPYWNGSTQPKCRCKEWKKHHISIPQFDLQRYMKTHEEQPNIPHYIIIGDLNKIYAIVKLEEWINHNFEDYNTAFEIAGDNPEQSVICLKQTPHDTNLEQWIKKMKMPT